MKVIVIPRVRISSQDISSHGPQCSSLVPHRLVCLFESDVTSRDHASHKYVPLRRGHCSIWLTWTAISISRRSLSCISGFIARWYAVKDRVLLEVSWPARMNTTHWATISSSVNLFCSPSDPVSSCALSIRRRRSFLPWIPFWACSRRIWTIPAAMSMKYFTGEELRRNKYLNNHPIGNATRNRRKVWGRRSISPDFFSISESGFFCTSEFTPNAVDRITSSVIWENHLCISTLCPES